jgi:metallophosphoesterase superfamily enzyme
MHIHGDWLLTPARVAVHRPTATAVVADLHLGYDEARRRGGEAVPVRPVGVLLEPLGSVLAAQRVRRLVIAGDLFEDRPTAELVSELAAWVGRAGVDLAGIVPGNHDRGLEAVAGNLPLRPDGVDVAGWRVVHGDGALSPGRIVQGHEHPWFRWHADLGGPCYLAGESRLVLPAYSPDAAGVDVRGDPRWAAYHCCVIAGDRVLDFGPLADLRR